MKQRILTRKIESGYEKTAYEHSKMENSIRSYQSYQGIPRRKEAVVLVYPIDPTDEKVEVLRSFFS